MKTLQEITAWEVPNHVYFLSDNREKCYGYVKASTGELFKFKTPYSFSISRRKFREIPNTYGFSVAEDQPEGFVKFVTGSKGEQYTITEVDGVRRCSCAGFKFRSNCRHTEL